MWRTLQPGFDSIVLWWENAKLRIKELSIIHGVRRARERRERLQQLQQTCNNENMEIVVELLKEENRGAFIRARGEVLDDGERPGGYFPKMEKKKMEDRCIKQVKDANDKIVSGDDVISVFHEFYSKLYANDDNIDADIQNMFLDCLPKAITGEKSEALNKPFELHELKKAIVCMSKNKSPGIDGIPVEFYQQFYDVIAQDLLAVYHEIYKNNLMSESQRTAVLSLLPKKGDPLDPANRRPISLLTVDYKIISKVLQLRLSHVMPDIVDEHQTCSVPGRSIHSNLCLLRVIVDCSKICNNCCALISMDQHKAFDKVNWVFLFKVLEKLNFGSFSSSGLESYTRILKVVFSLIMNLEKMCALVEGFDRGVHYPHPSMFYLLSHWLVTLEYIKAFKVSMFRVGVVDRSNFYNMRMMPRVWPRHRPMLSISFGHSLFLRERLEPLSI